MYQSAASNAPSFWTRTYNQSNLFVALSLPKANDLDATNLNIFGKLMNLTQQ